MLRRSPLAVVPPLLLLLALGGCGSDSLSTDQLRSQASTICTRTAAATDRIAVPNTADQGSRFLSEGVAQLRPAIAQLRQLKPPDSMSKEYQRAVALGDQEVTLIAKHRQAIAKGEDVIDTFRRLASQLTPLTNQEDAYWRALLIPACVRR
jgi:hypothetical protein